MVILYYISVVCCVQYFDLLWSFLNYDYRQSFQPLMEFVQLDLLTCELDRKSVV